MKSNNFNILLADDDEDDCMFFRDALDELSLSASLQRVDNGVELMNFLEDDATTLPHVLFLDLNMPLKTGLECFSEIKQNDKLKELPIIIYSTSSNPEVIDLLHNNGAQHYIRKPADFSNLKTVINKAIALIAQNSARQSTKETFLIQP
jgi:CheY-like chemotaxis protein